MWGHSIDWQSAACSASLVYYEGGDCNCISSATTSQDCLLTMPQQSHVPHQHLVCTDSWSQTATTMSSVLQRVSRAACITVTVLCLMLLITQHRPGLQRRVVDGEQQSRLHCRLQHACSLQSRIALSVQSQDIW